MPQLIRTIDDIMAQQRQDTLFIEFDPWPHPPSLWRDRHFQWFRSKGLRYEVAATKGWLEGDPGIFVVYFDGPDDPRVTEYSAKFETADGNSFDPDVYQMVIYPYDQWLASKDGNTDQPL